jgi:hypothetical protein
MNEEEFKRHLKNLVHGHHHPEEHDWAPEPGNKAAPASERSTKRPKNRKSTKAK